MRQFLVKEMEGGGWEVVNPATGETTGRLRYGEMLEQIVALLPPSPGRRAYQMKTPEEWDRERQERFNNV